MKKLIFTICTVSLFSFSANAQIDSLKLNLDFRTRAELDNGQKTLIPYHQKPETNVYSRAQLGVDYFYQNLELI